MMFEVQDLAVASPATVSRCGMVYLEPSILGLMPFVECWLKRFPAVFKPYQEHFKTLFLSFLEVSEATGCLASAWQQGAVSASHGSGVPSPAGIHRLRPVFSEGGDRHNQQQPNHESPQALGLLLQALLA